MRTNVLIEEQYRTPTGCLDTPFCYVFDSTGIADARAEVLNLAKPLQGDSDFILRRIVGVNNCVASPSGGGRFNLRNSSGSLANAHQSAGVIAFPNWVVLPEKAYPKSTQISFDLFNTLRAQQGCNSSGGSLAAVYTSYIAFFGIKRFTGLSKFQQKLTPYKYREQKSAYAFTVTLNWAHFVPDTASNPSPAHKFSQLINNWDFELQRIAIAPLGSTIGSFSQDLFSITLYDANKQALSDLPLNQSYINNGFFNTHLIGGSFNKPYSGLWPVPSIVYPAGSEISFDIVSNLCASDANQANQYQILFDGVWRVAC